MPTLSIPRRPSSSAEHPVVRAGSWVVVVLLGAFCARLAISHYGRGAIEALIVVPMLIVVARRPVFAVIVLLAVVASTFAYGVLPRANLPGHPPVNVGDLALAAAVGGTLWRRPWDTWPAPVKRYLLALVLLLAVSAVATLKTSLLGATQARAALFAYRNFLYLGVALTIALELRAELWRPLINGLIAFAGGLSILAVLAAAIPSVGHALQSVSPTTVYSPSAVAAASGVSVGSTARVRLQGLFFIYSMLIPALVMVLLVKDRWRNLRLVALLLMLAAVGVSLDRNMYGGALVGVLVTALLGGAKVRYRIGLIALAVIVAITLVITGSVAPAITKQIGKRAGSVFAPSQVLQSNSFQDRAYELSFALPSIARHPWFGVGPRQGYGALVAPNRFYGQNQRFFVQNLYVDLATDYGIPTALAFLLIPGVCLAFGLSRLRAATDPLDRGLLAAGIGTLIGLVLSCSVDTFVQDPSSTVAFGLACGMLLAAGLRADTTRTRIGARDVQTN